MLRRIIRAWSSILLATLLVIVFQVKPAQAANVTTPFHVNFQSQNATPPTGYSADYGQAFDTTRGYGWVDGAGTPLSLVGNGRERNAVTDKRFDTFMHMQLPAGSSGVTAPGAWKAAVPNGTYSVTVAAGDPSYFDSHSVVNVQGQKVIDFTPTTSNRQVNNTITVEVATGFLTVDAIGGTNTKIDFLDAVLQDPTPPPPPPNPAPASAKVNFQAQSSATPSGYSPDFGQAFDATRGYGWEDSTGAPMSLVGNGRERNLATDKRLDTIMQPQLKAGSAGVTTQGKWELAVSNGTYDVVLGVGDPGYSDSHDVINAEGVKIVDFIPTDAQRQTVVAAQAVVADGRLTLDFNGGTNGKVAYLTVSTATGTPPAGSLKVSSPQDYTGLSSRLVFSTVKTQSRPAKVLTLSNTGTNPLDVTNLAISGAQANDFKFTSGQATSFTIAAGASQTVSILYTPNGGGYHIQPTYISHATLTITSNDATNPQLLTALGGLNAPDYASFWEPSLQDVFNTIGYNDNVVVTNKPQGNSISPASTAVGDEVVSAYWRRADTTKPVTMRPLAHYSGQNSSSYPSFGWYDKGSGTKNFLYSFPVGAQNDNYGENQMLFPGTTTSNYAFSPTGSFGYVDSQNTFSDDFLNQGSGHWHDVRWYPAKDSSGNVLANTWLVADDVGGPVNNSAKNWDNQDFVFVVTNAQPDGANNQPAPGVLSQNLSSFPGTAGGVAGSGFPSAQGTIDTSKITFANNQLRIATSNDTNTAHTNALQLGVNAGTQFAVQSRLVGPFDAIDAGAEQQGIYFGPDGNNYLKAEVEWNSTDNMRHVTVWKEQNGSGSILYSTPLPATAASVDLRIDIDPSPQDLVRYNGNPYANVSYALSGSSTFTRLNTADISIPTGWITSNTPAGVVTSHQQGGTQFTAVFANFAVSRNY